MEQLYETELSLLRSAPWGMLTFWCRATVAEETDALAKELMDYVLSVGNFGRKQEKTEKNVQDHLAKANGVLDILRQMQRSGRGKSTHAKNWLTYYPDRARIINGDEPIIRRVDGIYRAYGTPFCGKERYNINTSAPLQGLCYLQRGETNAIERMEPTEAFAYLMTDYQNYGTIQEENRLQYMDLLTDFVEKIPVYILTCNQDPEAARVAFEGMRDGWAAMRHGGR